MAGDEPTRTPVGETVDGEAKERDELRAKVRIGNLREERDRTPLRGRRCRGGVQRRGGDGGQRLSAGAAGSPRPRGAGHHRHRHNHPCRGAGWIVCSRTRPRCTVGVTFESVLPGVASVPGDFSAGGTPVQRGRTEAATASAWTIASERVEAHPQGDPCRVLRGRSDADSRPLRCARARHEDGAHRALRPDDLRGGCRRE